jgi:NADPH:quinone reductase-like Zn-dependent oxidoreductase
MVGIRPSLCQAEQLNVGPQTTREPLESSNEPIHLSSQRAKMAKIVRFYEYGGPEVLRIEEAPAQQPGKGEVRLRVQAIGLNRAESMFFHNQYLEQPKLPSRLGYEAAGVVEALGPDVDESWLGKQVATVPAFSMNTYGTVGEQAVAPVSALGEYPAKLSAVEGAAYGALIEICNLAQGDFVIITAASSSVGIAAIEMAKTEGAISIATTRTSQKRKELYALGADHVIACEEEDFLARVNEITAGKGARVVFDPVAGPFVNTLVEATARHGIIVEYGLLSGQATPFPVVPAIAKGLTIRGYTLIEITTVHEKLAIAKKYIWDRLQDGRFRPKIAKTFPFAQTVEAYRYLESNVQVGKIVITVP